MAKPKQDTMIKTFPLNGNIHVYTNQPEKELVVRGC